jgi:predicted tellurium resistance membrane protein TerC
LTLLILELAIGIPRIVIGSTPILKLTERFPPIITLGAALLG